MKKTKIFIVAITTASFALSSCGNDFLTVSPPTKMGYDDYYKNESDIMSALTAAYAPMLWEHYSFGYTPFNLISDIMGGDVYPGGPNENDNPQLQKLLTHSITDLQQPDGVWTNSFSGVNRCQLVLENLPNVQGLTDATRKRIEAEAIFMRCYYYHNLWRLWGNIPYFEKNLAFPYVTAQVTADEVYAKCVAALDGIIAARSLPETVPTAELGRATLAAAQMLRARFVMYQMDESKFPAVLADMQDIITKGHHSLKTTTTIASRVAPSGLPVTPFEELFMREGEWCSETIFDINHTDYGSLTAWQSPAGAGGSVFPRFIGPRDMTANSEFEAGWGFGTIPVATYELYDEADTRRDAGILNFDKWATAYAANNGVAKPGRGVYGYYQVTGLFLKKYLCRVGYNVRGPGTGSGDMAFSNNMRIFRYAETLLNAAEMILRTNGPVADAQKYLDLVRDRAYGDADAPPVTATIENILLERRKEFMGEGIYYWDLVRTGKAQEVLGANGWTPSKKYWPIPNAEMNNTAGTAFPLTQNPY